VLAVLAVVIGLGAWLALFLTVERGANAAPA
jgi:hypothetical protein